MKHISDRALNEVISCGARVDRLCSVTREGSEVLDLKYADFDDRLYGVGLHRDVLFRSLRREMEELPNAEISLGSRVDFILYKKSILHSTNQQKMMI